MSNAAWRSRLTMSQAAIGVASRLVGSQDDGLATLWCVLRQKRIDHVCVHPQVYTGGSPENVGKVAEWVEPVFFSRFSEAMIQCCGASPGGRCCEKEVLAVYYIRFYAPLNSKFSSLDFELNPHYGEILRIFRNPLESWHLKANPEDFLYTEIINLKRG